jgi:hypothetical protein
MNNEWASVFSAASSYYQACISTFRCPAWVFPGRPPMLTSESPPAGRRYTSVGVPGTGVSSREYHEPAAHAARCDLCEPGHVHFLAWLVLIIVLAIVIAVIASNGH